MTATRVFLATQRQLTDGDEAVGVQRIADDAVALFGHVAIGQDEIGFVEIDRIDATSPDELHEFDGLPTFQLQRIDLVILEQDVLSAFDLVTQGDISRLDLALAGHNLLIADALLRGSVDLVKRDLLVRACRRDQSNGDGHQRETEMTFPEASPGIGHFDTPHAVQPATMQCPIVGNVPRNTGGGEIDQEPTAHPDRCALECEDPAMSPTTAIGIVAALCSTISFAPQAVKIIRTRDTKSISKGMYLLTVVGFVLWLSYGVLLSEWPLIASNGFCLLLSAFILLMKCLPQNHKDMVADLVEPTLPGKEGSG